MLFDTATTFIKTWTEFNFVDQLDKSAKLAFNKY